MGVPALFRWLSQRYPKIILPVIEDHSQEIDGVKIPIDYATPNPNGEEMDNLYLDMNGIVHPCSHPEDRPAPENEEEMMLEVFKYTERVVNMARPRKLLMMAVDGVAPRAKMNQQRSRRFRSAQEAAEKDEERAEFLKLLSAKKADGATEEDVHAAITKKTWDSNAITPGTPFMNLLALSLRYWVAYKLNTDPGWATVKVIISDATVPGEGEHKIMEFIRSQRRSPEHDPNTRHVIYGLDADLIMLGLATHEPHFRVLREDVFAQSSKPQICKLCGQGGHKAEECRGEAKEKTGEFDEKQNAAPLKPFIWLNVAVLREYLQEEMNVPNLPFPYDLERVLDDWIFMCFFVGNDFLPHLPSLEIREEGIDTLLTIWRDNLARMGGYVTKDGVVNLERAQVILEGLSKQESAIFIRRREQAERRAANQKRRNQEARDRKRMKFSLEGSTAGYDDNTLNSNPSQPQAQSSKKKRPSDIPSADDLVLFDPTQAQSNANRAAQRASVNHEMIVNRSAVYESGQANKSAAAIIKNQLLARVAGNGISNDADTTTEDDSTPATGDESSPTAPRKRKADQVDEETGTPGRDSPIPKPQGDGIEEEKEPEDTVRLWEEGYADRYYEQKFHVDPKDIEFRHKVARSYVEGLCWVLLYYFQGCPSWTWYYPYHYAPFAADFVDMAKMDIKFEKGKPFRPYEQLMGVMPAASSHTLPEVFRSLMSDEDSDIVDFYPKDFPIDLNGKKFAWQGVAILPFIDEKRLLKAMATKYPLLTAEEHARNEVGDEVLMFSTNHPLYEDVAAQFYSKKQGSSQYILKPKVSGGLSGIVEKNEAYIPQSTLSFPLESSDMPTLDEDQSISVNYQMPKAKKDTLHKSMLLRGLVMPKPVLDETDRQATRSRASRSGRNYGGAPLRQGYGNGRGRGRGGNRGGRDGPPNHYGQPPSNFNPENPFAAHLNPGFNPGITGRAPPPPHMAAAQGWLPPPPPGMVPPPNMQQFQGGQWDRDNRNGNGFGYGGGGNGSSRDYNRPPYGSNNNNNYGGGGRGRGRGDRRY